MSNTHKLETSMKPYHQHETRLALLEQLCCNTRETLQEIRHGLLRIENKIESLENKVNEKSDQISQRIWANFYWGISGFASVLALLAHALRWI